MKRTSAPLNEPYAHGGLVGSGGDEYMHALLVLLLLLLLLLLLMMMIPGARLSAMRFFHQGGGYAVALLRPLSYR